MAFDANEMMLELFRSEVESHSESLTSSLLHLEREQPDKSFFDSMMRAAHSIKGAARIVGIAQVVDISHVMEDCFVAAQRGELALGPDHVDVMLRGVDLMVKISEGTKDTAAATLALTPQVESVVEHLKCVRSGQAVPNSSPAKIAPVEAQPTANTQPSTVTQSIAQPVSAAVTSEVVTPSPAGSPPTVVPSSPPSVPPSSPPSVPPSSPPYVPTELRLKCPAMLDQTQAVHLRQQLLEHWRAGGQQITIDLSQTKELDAVGLAFLASAKRFGSAQSGLSIALQPLSTEMQMVLRVAGVDP